MKLLQLFVFSTLYYNSCSSILPMKKICKDCRHFIGDTIECRKFGDVDLVTGKVTYPSAKYIRDDSEKCGENATHFEENRLTEENLEQWNMPSNYIGESLSLIHI